MAKCRGCGANVKYPTKRCPHCGKRMTYPVAGVVAVLCCLAFLFVVKFTLFNGAQVGSQDAVANAPSNAPASPQSPTNQETANAILGPGTYTVGKDIAAGTYDCVAVSGLGVLRGDVAAFGELGFAQTMGSASASVGNESVSIESVESYSNLTLTDGDVIYIELSLKVEFIPK